MIDLPLARCTGAAVLAAAALTGCGGGSLSVAVPTPSAEVQSACADLNSALPSVVNGQNETPIDPPSSLIRAWGDPEIVLSCGVERPQALLADAQLFEIDGVTWFAEELSAGTRFTTVERVAYVQVDVPEAYRPEAEALIDLAPALKDTIPTVPTP